MIKPEDVPDLLMESLNACETCDHTERRDIAAILNAAIEAGVVSPPVYCTRDDHGNLLDYDVYGLWTSPDGAESQHKEDYTAEHWKGQTE